MPFFCPLHQTFTPQIGSQKLGVEGKQLGVEGEPTHEIDFRSEKLPLLTVLKHPVTDAQPHQSVS